MRPGADVPRRPAPTGGRDARLRRLLRLRPTTRGWGVGIGGLVLAGLGVGLGSTDLIRLGLVGPLVVLAGVTWLLVVDPTRGRHPLR